MRRTTTLTISSPGRDNGKRFFLTEMSADVGERWAIRALLALTNAGAELPDDVRSAGVAGLALFAFSALTKLKYEGDVQMLLNEMLDCVKYVPNKGDPVPLLPGDMCQVEEVATFFELRQAVFSLHVDFSKADAPPTSASGALRKVRRS